jgi:hypothetical protein
MLYLMIFQSQDQNCRPDLKIARSAFSSRAENMGNTNNHKNDEENVSRWGHHLVDGGPLCCGRGSVRSQGMLG